MNNICLLGLGLGALAGAGAAAAISKYYDLDGGETALAVGSGALLGGAGGYLAANLLCPAEDPYGLVAAELEMQQSQAELAAWERQQRLSHPPIPIDLTVDSGTPVERETACSSESVDAAIVDGGVDVNLEAPDPIQLDDSPLMDLTVDSGTPV